MSASFLPDWNTIPNVQLFSESIFRTLKTLIQNERSALVSVPPKRTVGCCTLGNTMYFFLQNNSISRKTPPSKGESFSIQMDRSCGLRAHCRKNYTPQPVVVLKQKNMPDSMSLCCAPSRIRSEPPSLKPGEIGHKRIIFS